MAAFPSFPVVPGTGSPSYVGEPSMVVAPGTWALTRARAERAARAILECMFDCLLWWKVLRC